jgi:hypothetical protein
LLRDALLAHEAAEIALELVSDVEVKLPHTDNYTALGCIRQSHGGSDADRNPVMGEHRFYVFLHQT